MNYEIISYGGAAFLRYIFNGIAMIFGNENYAIALATATLLGYVSWMIKVAFTSQGDSKALNPSWFFGVLFLFYGFLVPKVDLIIRDDVNPTNSNVVGSVPFGLALTATIFSTFSEFMTETAESVFSLPNGVRYTQSGLLFSSRLVDEISQVTIQNARQSLNWQDFFKNCVYYDLLLNRYSWDQLARANNLPAFLKDNTSESLQFTYAPPTGDPVISGCKARVGDMVDELDSWMEDNYQPVFMARLNNVDDPDAPNRNAQAVSRYAAAMPLGITYLTGLSTNASDMMQQSALLHSLRRGLSNFASDANASAAAQDFATTRAEAERRNTFLAMGGIAKKFIPMLHLIFEAIIYAVFPLILVMAMTPLVSKVLISYITVLFWVNLWPPSFAIINFAVTYFEAMEAKSRLIYDSAGGTTFSSGYNLITSGGLHGLHSEWAGVAGYLLAFVPMISYMLVSRSGAMAAGMVGRLMQGYEKPVSSGSDEATKGNIDLGNTRFENQSAFQTNMSPSMETGMASYRDGMGVTHNMTGGGETSEHLQTRSALSMEHLQQNTSSKSTAYQEAKAETAQASATFNEQSQAVIRSAFGVSTDVSTGANAGTGVSSEFSSGLDSRLEKVEQKIESYGERESLSESQVNSLKVAFGLGGGLKGVSLGASADTASQWGSQEMQEHLNQFLSQEQVRDSVADIAKFTDSNKSDWKNSVSDGTKDAFEASEGKFTSAQEQYSRSVSDEMRAMETWQSASTLSNAVKVDNIDSLRQVLSGNELDGLIHQASKGTLEEQQTALDTLSHAAMQVYQGDDYQAPAFTPNSSAVDDFASGARAVVSAENTGNIDTAVDEANSRGVPDAVEPKWDAMVQDQQVSITADDVRGNLEEHKEQMDSRAKIAEQQGEDLSSEVKDRMEPPKQEWWDKVP
ncbi:conjugal transfer protein TraG N-terminal domain-containing protein [uncultured Microbulbifer sp.]|uniref:conjugal transfer protein TraG N-terminal domain-containing protein n=1 Tax=uncultured Microbulbifer sp. TaxID=348147 RepID=UPI00260A8C6A|nr:conjugal transfer protein TraG N-terminal domain-containing protein [uncultured Microbulbifer sp.]